MLFRSVGARHRTVHSTERDPSGKYTAIYTYLTYQSIVPTNVGGSSDKPCFFEIIDSEGNSLGEIPVQMLQIAGVTWLSHGAEVKMVGEWDFSKKTCFYWAEDDTTRIQVPVE